ncbi:potassium channel family protein [Geodermatophilus marinus]|uniref:potassium channel family protein n=1 Tax=Geodermatophilus sp. LHW52908 TaxID=2303986 RepID=UPI000E3CE25E|nr:potassium channel family protein [Geodermatophilus sp. LHW52908]RFU19894.1 two pore domain potassium channel family protein [Geodermatophilus sp. LHW52908]
MAHPVPTDDRLERWEQAAEWPLIAAAVLFVVAYAWPVIDPDLAAPWPEVLTVLTWATWTVFAVDYLVRLGLARDRGAFVRTHVVDLALVVLPLFRPLRLLRLVTLLNVLNRNAGRSLRGRVAVYVAGATTLVLFLAAVAALDAERDAPDANITGFPDAVWWAFATVTTVGYGDRFPVTPTGRAIAVGLMLAGIALLGVVTAALASWLVERVEEVEEESQAATRRDVHALADEVARLRAELARSRARPERDSR